MKTIHAVYEDGVFRPVDPIELPEKCEVELTVHSQRRERRTTLAKLAEIGRESPQNSALPTDLAAQHDHYLYGTPKRP